MKIGIADENGKTFSVSTPEEAKNFNKGLGYFELGFGSFGLLFMFLLGNDPGHTAGRIIFIAIVALLAFISVLGAWHVFQAEMQPEDNSSPIPDESLVKIIDFIKNNDAQDVLEEHIQVHGSLEWDNLKELSGHVGREMCRVQTQRKNEKINIASWSQEAGI